MSGCVPTSSVAEESSNKVEAPPECLHPHFIESFVERGLPIVSVRLFNSLPFPIHYKFDPKPLEDKVVNKVRICSIKVNVSMSKKLAFDIVISFITDRSSETWARGDSIMETLDVYNQRMGRMKI